ncbi:unnamed protein product [Prunus brigantina]
MATYLVLYWLIDCNIWDEHSGFFFLAFKVFCSKSFRTLPDYIIASEVVFPSATLCFPIIDKSTQSLSL